MSSLADAKKKSNNPSHLIFVLILVWHNEDSDEPVQMSRFARAIAAPIHMRCILRLNSEFNPTVSVLAHTWFICWSKMFQTKSGDTVSIVGRIFMGFCLVPYLLSSLVLQWSRWGRERELVALFQYGFFVSCDNSILCLFLEVPCVGFQCHGNCGYSWSTIFF